FCIDLSIENLNKHDILSNKFSNLLILNRFISVLFSRNPDFRAKSRPERAGGGVFCSGFCAGRSFFG
ncbi:MAG: hypothetical protein JSU88_05945, partial [Nitrospinaceae bacterium]